MQAKGADDVGLEPFLVTSVAQAGISDQSRDNWRKVILALESLRSLQDNWDGLDAAAPSPGIVDSAVELASRLAQTEMSPPTTAVPTPAGTILFAWEGSEYLELEICSPCRAEWMHVDSKGVATHGELLPRTVG
jgi:hypothetical protein